MEPSNIDLNQLEKEGYTIGGIEPDSKAFVKGLSGRKNLAPKYEYDPIAEREKKFSQLIEIDEQVKALLAVKDQLKDSFKAELESLEEELEGELEESTCACTSRGTRSCTCTCTCRGCWE